MMAGEIDRLRQELRTLIADSTEFDVTSLSKAIGRGKDYLGDFLRGKKDSLRASEITAVEQRLGKPGALMAVVGGSPDMPPSPTSGYRSPPEIFGERDLPVFAAVEGGPGEMVVSTDPIEVVPRPWFLKNVRDGFAVIVTGESMVPAFEPGDIAVVNPRLPVLKGRNAIFTSGEHVGAHDFRATIKQFVGQTPSEWRVRQWNPAKEMALPRKAWPNALRVVGKLEG